MKRFISIMLTAVLLAMVIPFNAFAVESNSIISQPTVENPAFSVTNPEDATYEWYAHPGVVTPTKADPITEDLFVKNFGSVPEYIEILESESTFNWENAKWSPVIYQEDDLYILVVFNMRAYGDDMWGVKVEGVESAEVIAVGSEYGIAVGEELDGFYYLNFDESDVYTLIIETNVAPVEPKITVAKIPQTPLEPMEGENSATLSKMEPNVYYACCVEYENGEYLESDFVGEMYAVTKQPTSADPSVEVTYPDNVKSYQWYGFEKKENIAVTDKIAESYNLNDCAEDLGVTVPEGIFTEIKGDSTYDSEKDVWVPSMYVNDLDGFSLLYFALELQAGDSITLALCEASNFENTEIVFINIETMEPIFAVENPDGSATFNITQDGKCIVFGMSVLGESTNLEELIPEDYAVSVSGNMSVPVAIEGATANKLTKSTYGARYFCEVTFDNDIVVESEKFKVKGEILKQPTAIRPTVTVSYPEAVESYQWFKVSGVGHGPITPFDVGGYSFEDLVKEYGEPPIDLTVLKDKSIYNYETEVWTPVAYGFLAEDYYCCEFFNVFLDADESMKVEVLNGVDSGELNVWCAEDYRDAEILENPDGSYTVTATEAGVYAITYDAYEILSDDFGVKIYKDNVSLVEVIEVETQKTLSEKVVGETYVCVITYNDGAMLVTDSFTVTEDDMIVMGDATGDDVVDMKDYALIKRYCFGTANLDETQLRVSDINGDGVVDMKDYGLIKRHCFGTYVI